MLQQLILCFIGFCAGIIVAGGVSGLLIGLSIVPRYAGITHTADQIFLYEDLTLLGTVAGTVVTLFPIRIPLGPFFPGCLRSIFRNFPGRLDPCTGRDRKSLSRLCQTAEALSGAFSGNNFHCCRKSPGLPVLLCHELDVILTVTLPSHERIFHMQNINQKKYEQYVKQLTPTHSLPLNMAKAFLTGGLICLLGQVILNTAQALGVDASDSRTWCSVILILLSVLLTGFGIYPKIGKFGGAGSLVPITGFANSVAASAIEFRAEGQVFGIGCKIFTIAGPVILYGILSAWGLGVIYYILKILEVIS